MLSALSNFMARKVRGAAATLLWTAIAGTLLSAGAKAEEADACQPYCAGGRFRWPFHWTYPHHRQSWNMEAHGARAASTVIQGFHAQAQNGTAIEMTLWNHNFEEGPDGENGERSKPTSKLHPSALALLHRAARRHAHQPGFLVLVQTAHDIEFTPDQLDGYAHDLDQLDAARVTAVKEYLVKVLRRPDARVAIHDPPIVGMPAEEMKAAYANMIKYGPKSVLETVDPEIRPAGAYATSPDGIGGLGGAGFIGPPGGPGGGQGP
jgi:hypothetical protein